jgi:hypothetical protein
MIRQQHRRCKPCCCPHCRLPCVPATAAAADSWWCLCCWTAGPASGADVNALAARLTVSSLVLQQKAAVAAARAIQEGAPSSSRAAAEAGAILEADALAGSDAEEEQLLLQEEVEAARTGCR